jgi:hypothetical protein
MSLVTLHVYIEEIVDSYLAGVITADVISETWLSTSCSELWTYLVPP